MNARAETEDDFWRRNYTQWLSGNQWLLLNPPSAVERQRLRLGRLRLLEDRNERESVRDRALSAGAGD